ncbi:type II toxin-antitoxin system RelB family antitoxin [Arcanobacterium canis]
MSASTKRPASVYVREALDAYLEDLEDYYEAVETLQRVRSGREKTYSLAEVGEILGAGDEDF